ncbi:MAG TPA: non-homologous end-joining DNA ligase [Vicinamibacterales bacterium]|nr:non-homologous end-joining DNA ligase [Vicinamibacterales bacterium]
MDLSPMLATLADAPLVHKGLVYEPKYDGIRALVEVLPRGRTRLWSRNGNEKTNQFPAVVKALEALSANLKRPIVLDGEVVALDESGRPAGFQRLQGRMHLLGSRDIERAEQAQPVAFIAFDLLRDGNEDLCKLPLTARRQRLEKIFEEDFRLKAETTGTTSKRQAATSERHAGPSEARSFRLQAEGHVIRLSEQVAGDATALHARAAKEGWEGLIAKDAASTYEPGRRSPAWRKIKLVKEQEFVVGGWTEPRQTRQYFGALLLGVQEAGRLKYVGHTGTGFDQKELARVGKLLKAREIPSSPFSERIKTNEPAHWARPDLVAQVRFTEWTADDKLRHPVYLGLRDDKGAGEVVRENPAAPSSVIEQLRALEDARKDGVLTLPNGDRLKVTNVSKVFWPKLKITKGELLRYYVEVSPYLLPAVADRPLVMKRFPNGVDGKAFYQQRSREERPPAGVRIEMLADDTDPISEPDAKRLIGGSLTTLLYMTQIAAISQDPWFSRVHSPLDADHVALDLDPTDRATFANVVDVARWVRDELKALGIPGFPKTSGSSGLHIYIPLPPGTSYETGQLLCQIVATLVATKHPRVATVERTVARRPRGTVYVDYLQNILGKTLATAYSARASDYAGVSTPLAWKEVDGKLDPRDFTIRTAPARFRKVGDLWEGLRTSAPADLKAVLEKFTRRSP